MTQNQRSIIDIQCEIRRSVLLKETSIVEISQTLFLIALLYSWISTGNLGHLISPCSASVASMKNSDQNRNCCFSFSMGETVAAHRLINLIFSIVDFRNLQNLIIVCLVFLLFSLPSWRFEQSHFQCSFASLLIVLSQYGDFEVSSHVPVVGQLIQSTFSTKERVQNHS